MAEVLDVYLGGKLVAKVTRNAKSQYQLRYQPELIQEDDPTPISVRFPVGPGVFTGEGVNRYFENLLPDNASVKQRWAQEAKLPDAEAFGLLAHYGADVAGAVEFYREGVPRKPGGELKPVSDEEIARRIRAIREDDTEWGKEDADRGFSLGGAQGKFALAFHEGEWFDPTGARPSTHIFKPGVRNYRDSDITEHVVMEVARMSGLPMAYSSVQFFGSERALVVERFDRRVSQDGAIERVHQEDFAQATGTSTLKKYEVDGGPTYAEIFEAMDRNIDPSNLEDSKSIFAASLIFSWIVGNHDGHSKNYSLGLDPGNRSIAPLYDMNTLFPYIDQQALAARDPKFGSSLKLAFAINNKREVGEITAEDWIKLAQDGGIDPEALLAYGTTTAFKLTDYVRDAIDALPEQARTDVVDKLPLIAYVRSRVACEALSGRSWQEISRIVDESAQENVDGLG